MVGVPAILAASVPLSISHVALALSADADVKYVSMMPRVPLETTSVPENWLLSPPRYSVARPIPLQLQWIVPEPEMSPLRLNLTVSTTSVG